MGRRSNRRRAVLGMCAAAAAATLVTSLSAPAIARPGHGPAGGFVQTRGSQLVLDGKPWRFSGTNNYYLMYGRDGLGNQTNVKNLFDDAQTAGFDVVRAWAFFTVMDPDPAKRSTSIQQGDGPTWFNAYDATTGKQVFNTGQYGLSQLDSMVSEAGKRGIKLVLPFTNNWSAYGGMDQYIKWADLADGDSGRTWYHDDFYTDPKIRAWFKEWISTLLNRTNTITGVKYKDDPTIAVWELANEPRCRGSVVPQRPGACDPGNTSTITKWSAEMSSYIKSFDRHHLVSLGDEGWICDPGNADTGEGHACTNGVDTEKVTRLKTIDLMSLHLYPDAWGYDAEWGNSWIAEHAKLARKIGKPSYLGEYGILDKSLRNPVYQRWLDTVDKSGMNGDLYWILSSKLEDGTLYPDYDGFTVYCPTPVCTNISNHAQKMANEARIWPPVADHDNAITEFDAPLTLAPLANDIAYGTKLDARTLDLAPATRGVQRSVTVTGGTFAVQADNRVAFTPAAGYKGFAQTDYTVRDRFDRLSNPATIKVQVKAQPGAPVQLFSFEDGTEGWTSNGNWTIESSTEFATEGTHSLKVNMVNEGWVPGTFASPLDLSEKTKLSFDVFIPRVSGNTGSSFGVSFQAGPNWDWCQANAFAWFDPNADQTADGARGTVTIDLTAGLSCDVSTLTEVHQVNVFMNAGGVRYLDNVVLQ